jgi:hypothetical protein
MAPYISPEWLDIEKEMGGRPLLSGSFESYQKNAKAIEDYVVAHLPPRSEDGLTISTLALSVPLIFLIQSA